MIFRRLGGGRIARYLQTNLPASPGTVLGVGFRDWRERRLKNTPLVRPLR